MATFEILWQVALVMGALRAVGMVITLTVYLIGRKHTWNERDLHLYLQTLETVAALALHHRSFSQQTRSILSRLSPGPAKRQRIGR